MASLTEQQKAKVRELRQQGHGYRAIATMLNASDGAVRWMFEKEQPILVRKYRTYVWDIETTDFKADIGSLMVSSFLDLETGLTNSRTIHSFSGTFTERERKLAEWTCNMIGAADTLIGHNVKAFDRNFLSGVCARHRLPQPPKRTYIDTMLIARYGLKGKIGASMANLADVLGIKDHRGNDIEKDKPSKNDWREYIAGDPKAMERITDRCEADVFVNALLWERLREYWFSWKGER